MITDNPKESSTTKINKHAPSGSLLFTYSPSDNTKNILDHCSGQDCMKKFCKDLKEHAAKIVTYEEKEMIPLTYKKNSFYKNQKVCYICKKRFITDNNSKEYHQVKNIEELLIICAI